jgi:hypothetical protein
MKDTFYFIEPNSELDRKKRELYEAEQDRWAEVFDAYIEQMLDKEGEENS